VHSRVLLLQLLSYMPLGGNNSIQWHKFFSSIFVEFQRNRTAKSAYTLNTIQTTNKPRMPCMCIHVLCCRCCPYRAMTSQRGAVSAWDAIINRVKQLAAAHARGDPLSTLVPAVLEVLQWADDIPVLKQEPTRKLMFSMKVRQQGHDIICI